MSQLTHAQFLDNIEDAKKEALASSRLILVEFYCQGFKPSIKLQNECWNNNLIMGYAESFVLLRINVDVSYYFGRDNSDKRYIHNLKTSIIHILDPNGKIIDNIDFYENPSQLINLMKSYSLTTKYLSTDLVNFSKIKGFYSALRVSRKYYNYSLYVDENIRIRIINLAEQYLADAENCLRRKEEDFEIKKQKIKLCKLFNLAYTFNFEKLDEKISEIKLGTIIQANLYDYWFLKYISVSGTGKDTKIIEEQLKKNDLENVITDSNKLLTFIKNH